MGRTIDFEKAKRLVEKSQTYAMASSASRALVDLDKPGALTKKEVLIRQSVQFQAIADQTLIEAEAEIK